MRTNMQTSRLGPLLGVDLCWIENNVTCRWTYNLTDIVAIPSESWPHHPRWAKLNKFTIEARSSDTPAFFSPGLRVSSAAMSSSTCIWTQHFIASAVLKYDQAPATLPITVEPTTHGSEWPHFAKRAPLMDVSLMDTCRHTEGGIRLKRRHIVFSGQSDSQGSY